MPDGYLPAKPFYNGMDAEMFDASFCQRCAKRKYNDLDLPEPGNCRVENALAMAYFDLEHWPSAIMVDGFGRKVCLDFFSNDFEIMESYEQAVPQTYAGCTLHNLKDGYLAKNLDGTPALRSGSKANLETMLLVIHADKLRSTEAKHGEE